MQRDVSPTDEARFVIVDGRPTVRGDCDHANADHMEAWLASFTGPLEIDLSGVTFFDAAALRALLAVARRNPGIRVVESSSAVRRVLELTDTCCVFIDAA